MRSWVLVTAFGTSLSSFSWRSQAVASATRRQVERSLATLLAVMARVRMARTVGTAPARRRRLVLVQKRRL
uniref:Uncharacterized protein n=1 Tax=Hyaloperonospora arabidopsidis (strain Emoy2) TaxID=559515 RepID=M4B7L3_HYAAE